MTNLNIQTQTPAKIGTLFYFSVYPFNQDYGRKYGFQFFQERGFDIKVFDIMPIIYRHLAKESRNSPYSRDVCGAEQVRLYDYHSLEVILKELDVKTLAFVLCRDEYRLISMLNDYGIGYIKVENLSDIPPSKCSYPLLFRVFVEPITSTKKIYLTLLSKILKFVQYDLSPRYVLSREMQGKLGSGDTQVISVNSFDYDRVIENYGALRPAYLTDEQYYVLLVNHPFDINDYKMHGTKAITTPKEYAIKINRLLDMIEEKTGINVWIAAYPKATEEENIYNGRPFIYDTEQLVKFSSGVIGHHTGAFNFAIAHDKPICLIDLCDAPVCSQFSLINQAYSAEFKVPLYCVDTENDCRELVNGEIFSINEKEYREYKVNYLLSKDNKVQGKRVWKVFLDVVLEEYFT